MANLVTKLMDKFSYRCVGIRKNYKLRRNLSFTDYEAKQILYHLTYNEILALNLNQ